VHEDLARRDFTVNAMALRLADGALVTWPGAVEDLDRGLLRVLHDGSFDDDPTRMLRLARYAARLGFAPDEATARLRAAAIAGGALETVTGSRLGAELRLLLREPQPAALGALAEDGLGAALLGGGFSPEPDRIERALALSPPDARADMVALAVTLAAAGGEADGAGSDLAARLAGLDFPARDREIVAAAASSAPALAAALREGPDAVRLWRVLQRATPEAVAVAGALDEGAEAAARRWLDDVRHRRLAITGDDLVAAGRSGVAVGAALRAATEAMLAGEAPTRERQLAVALGTGP
jgi:tRNA nucleotidyltransferase (CCA-adding enzyme)